MKIGSIAEDRNIENRVAITPDIIKKYKSLGLQIHLSKGYGEHLGINDKNYVSEGATILTVSYTHLTLPTKRIV